VSLAGFLLAVIVVRVFGQTAPARLAADDAHPASAPPRPEAETAAVPAAPAEELR
jgi:hypothetical protein